MGGYWYTFRKEYSCCRNGFLNNLPPSSLKHRQPAEKQGLQSSGNVILTLSSQFCTMYPSALIHVVLSLRLASESVHSVRLIDQALCRKLVCKMEEIRATLRKHLAKEEEQLFPLLLKHFSFAEQVLILDLANCHCPATPRKVHHSWPAS